MKQIIISIFAFLVLSGCSISPASHKTSMVDDRSQIIFQVNENLLEMNLEVLIDGIEYGAITKFTNNYLRVVDGKHLIEVKKGNKIIYSTQLFLSAGMTQTIKVIMQ